MLTDKETEAIAQHLAETVNINYTHMIYLALAVQFAVNHRDFETLVGIFGMEQLDEWIKSL